MLMNKMAYEMPDYQSFVNGGRQSVRMRTSMDDVTSLGEYVLDFDPVTTPIDALMSYNYNPCLITMAGSNQATGPEHSPDTDNRVSQTCGISAAVLTYSVSPCSIARAGCDTGHRDSSEIQQRLLWLDLCAAPPKSLTDSDNAQYSQVLVSSLIQALDIAQLTAPLSGHKSDNHESTGLNNEMDISVMEDNSLNKADIVIEMDISDMDQDSKDMDDIEEACDSIDNKLTVTDNFVACFFNNAESSVSSNDDCNSNASRVVFNDVVDTVYGLGQVYATECTEFNVRDDSESYKPPSKRARFCKFDNESYESNAEYMCKPKKRVTFGPDKIKYFDKREVIDKELYLERKRSRRNTVKSRDQSNKKQKQQRGRKLNQVKTNVSKSFFGLGERLRKFFTRSEDYVL